MKNLFYTEDRVVHDKYDLKVPFARLLPWLSKCAPLTTLTYPAPTLRALELHGQLRHPSLALVKHAASATSASGCVEQLLFARAVLPAATDSCCYERVCVVAVQVNITGRSCEGLRQKCVPATTKKDNDLFFKLRLGGARQQFMQAVEQDVSHPSTHHTPRAFETPLTCTRHPYAHTHTHTGGVPGMSQHHGLLLAAWGAPCSLHGASA